MEHKRFGGMMKLFCILNVVVVKHVYAFDKAHRSLKANFTECNLCDLHLILADGYNTRSSKTQDRNHWYNNNSETFRSML